MNLNDLIDQKGGLLGAINYVRSVIARRASEGKTSPRFTAALDELLALPEDYQTPRQAHRLPPDYLS